MFLISPSTHEAAWATNCELRPQNLPGDPSNRKPWNVKALRRGTWAQPAVTHETHLTAFGEFPPLVPQDWGNGRQVQVFRDPLNIQGPGQRASSTSSLSCRACWALRRASSCLVVAGLRWQMGSAVFYTVVSRLSTRVWRVGRARSPPTSNDTLQCPHRAFSTVPNPPIPSAVSTWSSIVPQSLHRPTNPSRDGC